MTIDQRATALARRRYDRRAAVYDQLQWLMELRAGGWRRDLWARVGDGRVLELGIGTGKNIPFHPRGREIVGVDISERMLARAKVRAGRMSADLRLEWADVQSLPYEDASFDVVVATFLFCSVPDPLLGLREARRVLRPGGRLLLLEHVLSERRILRRLMRWFDPIPLHVWGAHIDRETAHTVREAGFLDVVETNLAIDVVKRIEATASPPASHTPAPRSPGRCGPAR